MEIGRRWGVRAGLAGLLAAVVMPASAVAATTLSAATDPTAPGTPSAPSQMDVRLSLSIDKDGFGTPTKTVKTLTFAIPAELVSQISKFGVCPSDTVAAIRNGKKSADACPKDSLLGTGQVEVVIPALHLDTTTDRAEMLNPGGGGIVLWYHATKPVEISATIEGKITQETGAFGPLITWDFSQQCCGSQGDVDISRFATNFLRNDAVTPSSAPAPKHKKASCRSRARKIKNTKRRRAALRRCARRHKRSRRASSSQATQGLSPLAATGCAQGHWGFEARLTYKSGAEKVEAQAPCAATSPPPPSGGGVSPCPLPPPLCPPATAATSQPTLLVDESARSPWPVSTPVR